MVVVYSLELPFEVPFEIPFEVPFERSAAAPVP